MFRKILVIEIVQESIHCHLLTSFLTLKWSNWSKEFSLDDEMLAFTNELRSLASVHKDLSIYAIASGFLDFAFDLPLIEDEADLKSAIALKLKGNLLFPIDQFIYCFDYWQNEGKLIVQVSGLWSKDIAFLTTKLAEANLFLHRLYTKEMLLRSQLSKVEWWKDGTALVMEKDDFLVGYCWHFNNSLMHVVKGLDKATKWSQLRVHMSHCTHIVATESLVKTIKEKEERSDVNISPLEESDETFLDALCVNPTSIASDAPFAKVNDESQEGPSFSIGNLMAAVAIFYLVVSFASLFYSDYVLTAEEASLSSSIQKVALINRTISKVSKDEAKLKKLLKGANLFACEPYDPLLTLTVLSNCRVDNDCRLLSLSMNGRRILTKCISAGRKDALAFVEKLKSTKLFEEIELSALNFDASGKVTYSIEMKRNG